MPLSKIKVKVDQNVKQVILNLEKCFKKELSRKHPIYSYENVTKRISNAVGVGLRSIYRVLNPIQKTENPKVKKEMGLPPKMDCFAKTLMRRVLHEMYGKGEFVSLKRSTKRMEEAGIVVSKTTVWRALKTLGFIFYKKHGRRFLKENQEIVAQRHSYLRKIRKYRREGYEIIFLDETWINSHHVQPGEWTENRKGPMSVLYPEHRESSRFIPSGKGQRLIILDAGSSMSGFIPDVGLIFASKTKSHDYHDEMNSRHFLEWFEHSLIPAIENPSVIVMDNAPYHNVKTDESWYPRANTTKQDMKTWLVDRGVYVEDDEIKAELMQKVRLNMPTQVFQTDKLANENGHFELRLPVRHCELNPIELIQDVKKLYENAKDSITREDWERAERHVIEKVEKRFWELDGEQDEEVDPVVINLDDDDDDDDDDAFVDIDGEEGEEGEDNELSSGETEEALETGTHVVGPAGDHCGEEEELCAICDKADPQAGGEHTDWVQCTYCDRWVHLSCTGKTMAQLSVSSQFPCKLCVHIMKESYPKKCM